MKIYYSFTASIPLQTPKTGGQEQAIGALEALLDACEDVSMEELDGPDGNGAWLEVRCPSQRLGHSFIDELDQAVATLGMFATMGFGLEYRYGHDDPGIDFHGPTEDSIQEARRQWLLSKASISLKEARLDLDTLLQALLFTQQVAELKIKGEPDPGHDGKPFDPCGGADGSHLCLMNLICQARLIASA